MNLTVLQHRLDSIFYTKDINTRLFQQGNVKNFKQIGKIIITF